MNVHTIEFTFFFSKRHNAAWPFKANLRAAMSYGLQLRHGTRLTNNLVTSKCTDRHIAEIIGGGVFCNLFHGRAKKRRRKRTCVLLGVIVFESAVYLVVAGFLETNRCQRRDAPDCYYFLHLRRPKSPGQRVISALRSGEGSVLACLCCPICHIRTILAVHSLPSLHIPGTTIRVS